VNAREFSLRELVWMATSRRRQMGELAAWCVCWIIARMPLTGTVLDPLTINPYATEPPPEKSKELAELEAWQAKKKWQIIHTPPKRK